MAKDRMLYIKLCFVVIVFGLSFIICNKHYIKYSACYKLPIPKTPIYPDAYKFVNTKEGNIIPFNESALTSLKYNSSMGKKAHYIKTK